MADALRERDLTDGSLANHLLRLWVPMTWGVAMVMSVALVDTFFVGRYGEKPLTALGFAFPMQMVLTSLGIGLSAAATSLVSKARGRDETKLARRHARNVLAVAVGVATLVALAGAIAAPAIFRLQGASGESLELVTSFMRLWLIGLPFLVFGIVSNGIMRAEGESSRAALVMTTTAVVNAALDPIFIFGLGPIAEFGLDGAAFASIIARLAMAGIAVWFLLRDGRSIATHLQLGSSDRFAEIGQIAAPAATSNMINPLGLAALTAALALISEQAVAAFGVGSRVLNFAQVPLLGLSAAIGPLIGQNYGADLSERVRGAFMLCLKIIVGYTAVLAVALALFGRQVTALFTDSQTIADQAALFLMIVPASVFGYGALIVVIGALNAAGKPMPGTVAASIRMFVVTIPLAFLAAYLFDVWAVYAALAVGNVLGGAAALIAAHREGLL